MQEIFASAYEALKRLKEGNSRYIKAKVALGDVSLEKRLYTSKYGQQPYAVIVSCSDSRVVPEHIFSAGIGELFVIRVAGNVMEDCQLGSIEYAIEDLGCKLVVVLGHTQCGAVGAALQQNKGYLKLITDKIKLAVGEEKDLTKAVIANVKNSVDTIKESLNNVDGAIVKGAVYHTDSGLVDFIE